MQPVEVADCVIFMLTRPRNVTIRDLVILPPVVLYSDAATLPTPTSGMPSRSWTSPSRNPSCSPAFLEHLTWRTTVQLKVMK